MRRSNKRRASGTASRSKPKDQSWRITSRIVNTKRHTIGYVINGETYTVKQSAKLARQGRLSNARAVGNHVQALTGRKPLSSLPSRIKK